MSKATILAVDEQEARAYLVRRRADTDALMAAGITKLPYARVLPLPYGVEVNGVYCASALCAVAYILAKWW
jgi:hypothetical protein